jgi:hypothetical protein
MLSKHLMEAVREELFHAGAARIPEVLPPDLLAELREFCRAETETYKPGGIQRDSPAAPVYPTIPLYNRAIRRGNEVLETMGLQDARFLAGALIPKWRDEGRRGWHVDMWSWENSIDTWREVPPQIGLLCYLDDATPDTGALILLPTSHRREVPAHFETWESWNAHPDEVVIPANAGDAVILDPRAMHATTSNSTVDRRLCLTLWFLLEYEKLQPRTRATVMLSIAPDFKEALGPLCPEFHGPEKWFPHVKKPQFPISLERIQALGAGRSDLEILGPHAQPGDDFLTQGGEPGTYAWYWGLGAAKAPQRIMEFGVRYGYSAIAMARGALWAGVTPRYYGVDLEADGIASNPIAEAAIRSFIPDVRLIQMDTKQVADTVAALNGFGCPEIIHIDGDHSGEGIRAEIAIAKMYIRPNGLILIDDCDVLHVRQAAEELAAEYGIPLLMLPTTHGLAVIDMRKRTIWA